MSRIAAPSAVGPPGQVPCAATPERMFPVDESGPGQAPTVGERAALAVCAACPVLDRRARAA